METRLKWNELPDIITPFDLMKVMPIGETTARNIFNSKDFPRIRGTGVKQLADKRAVKYWCMGIDIKSETINKIINLIKEGEKYEQDN